MQRDIRISLIRVIAMFSIVICHIVQEYGKISFMGQIFNVGVFVFIFLSGFLYGRKNIVSIKDWILRRVIRIMIPIYIYMLVIFVMNGVNSNSFKVGPYLVYILGIQGFFPVVEGAAHLWFITAIIICYILTPLLYSFKKYFFVMSKTRLVFISALLIVMQSVFSFTVGSLIGRYMCYVMLYIFAYYLSFLSECKLNTKKYIALTGLTILGLCIRVLSRTYIDGSILYSNIIVLYSQCIFAIWIFFSLYKLQIIGRKLYNVIEYLDCLSFYIYIVHCIFITGKYKLIFITQYTVLNIAIVIGAIFISSILLHSISEYFYNIHYKKYVMT